MNALRYTRVSPSYNNLHYGAQAGSELYLRLSGTLALHHLRLEAALTESLMLEGALPVHSLTLVSDCTYRALLTRYAATFWPALPTTIRRTRSPLYSADPVTIRVRSAWNPLTGRLRHIATTWTYSLILYRLIPTSWPLLQGYSLATGAAWPALTPQTRYTLAEWVALNEINRLIGAPWPALSWTTPSVSIDWPMLQPVTRYRWASWGALRRSLLYWRQGLSDWVPPQWRWPRGDRPPSPPTPPPIPSRLNALLYSGANRPNTLHYGARPRFPYPAYLRTLTMQHDILIRSLPDEQAIACAQVEISRDIASWSTTIRLSVPRWSDIDRLFADPDNPGEVEILLDGQAIRGIATEFTESLEWNRRSFRVTCGSYSLLLGSPYAPKSTYTEATIKTAQQIAVALLAPFEDWSLDWDLPDWVIPAGVFSYQDLAPIEAIALLVKAVGGTLQTHLTEKVLQAVPVHPISPWDWETAEPNVILTPEKLFTQESSQAIRPGYLPYNGIHVSGRNEGVLALVRLQGTLGERQPTMIVDPLITHVDAARERGRAELAAFWPHPDVTINAPIFTLPDTPTLINPGELIEVRSSNIYWRGQVMSSQITANVAANGVIGLRQKVSLSSSNAWHAFQRLVPIQPEQSATVVAVDGNTVMVELVDGGMLTVFGTGEEEIGQRVFVKGGKVMGTAPVLPYSVLDAG